MNVDGPANEKNRPLYFGYNGLYDDAAYGRWLIRDGAVDFGFTGEYNDPQYGWCFVREGKYD